MAVSGQPSQSASQSIAYFLHIQFPDVPFGQSVCFHTVHWFDTVQVWIEFFSRLSAIGS